MTFTRARKLNVYYPNPGLMNPEVMYTLIINFFASVLVIYLFYIWIYFRVEHKDSLLIMRAEDYDKDLMYMEPFCFFILVGINSILMALSMNRGFPFKQGFFENKKLLAYVSFVLGLLLLLFNIEFFEGIFLGKFLIRLLVIP